jgi:hypothetical protein
MCPDIKWPLTFICSSFLSFWSLRHTTTNHSTVTGKPLVRTFSCSSQRYEPFVSTAQFCHVLPCSDCESGLNHLLVCKTYLATLVSSALSSDTRTKSPKNHTNCQSDSYTPPLFIEFFRWFSTQASRGKECGTELTELFLQTHIPRN